MGVPVSNEVTSVETPYVAAERELLLGLSWQTKAIFFRQLASGVGSGLPLARALPLAVVGLPSKMQTDLIQVSSSGMMLSQILARYPAGFDKYELALLQAGEKSGQLDVNLKRLAEHAEAEQARHNQQLSQAIYPLLLIHAAAIIPAFPLWVTKGGCCFWHSVVIVLGPLYAAAIVVYLLKRWARFNRPLDEALCALANMIPILSSWRRKEAQARFFVCFSQLQDAGLLASESVKLAGDSCGNVSFGQRLAGLSAAVVQGQTFSQALRGTGFFSEQVLALLATGEETGNLADMAARAAEMLQQDADNSRKRLAAILPVLVLLAVGAFVGYQVLDMFRGISSDLNGIMDAR